MATLSLRLTEDQEAGLEALAGAVGAVSTRGVTAGAPSWRVLLQLLGDGKIGVVSDVGGVYVVPPDAASYEGAAPVLVAASRLSLDAAAGLGFALIDDA